MYSVVKLLIAIFVVISTANAGSNIALPKKLPALEVTANDQLGTREANIGLKSGAVVEDFNVQTIDNKNIQFSSLLGGQNLIVVFYRGGWCPYCNLQVRQLSVAAPEFEKRNILPVLISADKPDGAMLVQKGYDIPFPVLSDADLVAHKAFNVVFRLPDELLPMYKEYGIVLSDWSGQDHQKFAVASVFILNKKGEVLWSHASTDYKTRPSVQQLLTVIDTIK